MYYHFNNVGSTTAVTEASGNVKYRYEYSPYGELISGTYGQVMFLYNGQYGVTSDDNGLYYMRARYYNISIKRFVNQDVLTGEIGESQSLNRYAYVEGNPVSYVDPFGLAKQISTTVNSVGYSFNIAYWLALGISVQLTTDGKGRTALQWGISFGVGTPGVSASMDTTGGTGEGYRDPLGWGLDAGIGAGWGGYSAGIGGSMGIGNKYKGATTSIGIGTPGLDAHVKVSYTWNIWESTN